MKLSRQEKQRENKNLDSFLQFAPGFLKKLKKNAPDKMSDDERELFAVAFRFLEREIGNRAEKGRKKAAKDEEINNVIKSLNENKITVEEAIDTLQISQATLYRYWNKNNKPTDQYKLLPALTLDEIQIFRQLSDGGKTDKLTAAESDNLQNGLAIIAHHREVAEIRKENLNAGREKLEKTFSKVKSRSKAIKIIREEKAEPAD